MLVLGGDSDPDAAAGRYNPSDKPAAPVVGHRLVVADDGQRLPGGIVDSLGIFAKYGHHRLVELRHRLQSLLLGGLFVALLADLVGKPGTSDRSDDQPQYEQAPHHRPCRRRQDSIPSST